MGGEGGDIHKPYEVGTSSELGDPWEQRLREAGEQKGRSTTRKGKSCGTGVDANFSTRKVTLS